MKRILALIIALVMIFIMAFSMALPVVAADAAAEVTAEASAGFLPVIIIIAAVFAVGIVGYFIISKLGMSVINIALAVVTAVRNALEDTNIVKTKFYTVLELIIESLTYVQAIYADALTSLQKAEKALDYINDIAGQFNLTFSAEEMAMIESVLIVGFRVMDALGAGSKAGFKLMYDRMARHAEINKTHRAIGLTRISTRLGAQR